MGLATLNPHSQKECTEIHKSRYSHLKLQNSTKSTNLWPTGRCFWWPYISLYSSIGCISLTIESIYTKLGDFVKFGVARPHVSGYFESATFSFRIQT